MKETLKLVHINFPQRSSWLLSALMHFLTKFTSLTTISPGDKQVREQKHTNVKPPVYTTVPRKNTEIRDNKRQSKEIKDFFDSVGLTFTFTIIRVLDFFTLTKNRHPLTRLKGVCAISYSIPFQYSNI